MVIELIGIYNDWYTSIKTGCVTFCRMLLTRTPFSPFFQMTHFQEKKWKVSAYMFKRCFKDFQFQYLITKFDRIFQFSSQLLDEKQSHWYSHAEIEHLV